MRIPYVAISVAAALGLAASALPAAAGTTGTPNNPEGGAGPTAGPDAGKAKRNATMPDYDTQGAASTNVPGSGSSFPPPQPSQNAGSISHPGKSFTNPEGGAPQTVGPNAGRAAREKSMGDFPTGAPK